MNARTTRAGSAVHGFTLIEVLVALSIIVIAMTSVYRLQGDTFRMSADARFYTLAPLLAKGKLSEIESQELKNAADGSGDFGLAYPGYNWTVRMEDVHSEILKDKQHHLTRIDLTITQDEKLSYALRTYRFHVD
ncbi:MAG: prepilin-type N-terminal cleavage/methylation domain-containing protein [Desulfatitalea sp.]